MKVAALDLGSNTFLCLIAEVNNGEIKEIYYDDVQMVRLGEGLSLNKSFSADALKRADACLAEFSQTIQKHRPEKILAMATAAARDASNKNELFNLGIKHNIPIEIISGDDEARITYLGAISKKIQTSSSNSSRQLVIDIGGGSTEFILGDQKQVISSLSANMGCVKWTERFFKSLPPKADEVATAENEIQKIIEQSLIKVGKNFDYILAVAGTPTSLVTAQLGHFDVEKIDGFFLKTEDLKNWKEKLSHSNHDEIVKMGIPAGRADVILIGVLILLKLTQTLNFPGIYVSTRGVRFGVALELYKRSQLE